MVVKDFEDVFNHVGGFGPFQYVLFAVVCLFNVFLGFMYTGQIFMTLTPAHHCALPPELNPEILTPIGFNLTQEQLVRLTIPFEDEQLQIYSKCSMFDADFVQILSENLSWPNSTWATKKCTHGWTYDYSYFYPTITSELNWVCDDDTYPTSAQSAFFIGGLVGSPLFGWLADAFGRMPIAVATNVIGGVFGLASAFSNSFWSFCILRFIVGMTFDSQFFIMYILALEYVSSPYRTFVANVPLVTFLTGTLCGVPWLAYGLSNWKWFGIAIAVPQLLCVILPWFIPESLRWLIGKGEVDKSCRILSRMADANGKELDPSFLEDFKIYAKKLQADQNVKITWYDLLKTPVLRKRFLLLCALWVCIAVAYECHVRQVVNLGSDFYITFTLMGAVECPADILGMFLMEWGGRRNTTSFSLISTGLIAFIIMFINPANTLTIAVLAISGRFMVTMAINVAMQFIVEVLPTAARAQGSGAIHTTGIAMSLFAPIIVYLSKFGLWITYAILGGVSLIGGLLTLFLPETVGEDLPDTLEDGENAFADQPMCFNPCVRKRNGFNVEDQLPSPTRDKESKNSFDNHVPITESETCI